MRDRRVLLRVRTLGQGQCQHHRNVAPPHFVVRREMRCAATTHLRCPGLGRIRAAGSLTRALPSRPDVDAATPSTPERVAAPLLEALVARASTPAAALHVPGHKVCVPTLCLHHLSHRVPTVRDRRKPHETPEKSFRLAAVTIPSVCVDVARERDLVPQAPAYRTHPFQPLNDTERAHTVAPQSPLCSALVAPGRAVERPRRTRRRQG